MLVGIVVVAFRGGPNAWPLWLLPPHRVRTALLAPPTLGANSFETRGSSLGPNPEPLEVCPNSGQPCVVLCGARWSTQVPNPEFLNFPDIQSPNSVASCVVRSREP